MGDRHAFSQTGDVKRQEYARAGIIEYWIIDPELRTITVLELVGDRYRVVGEFKTAQSATPILLLGFAVSVASVFEAAECREE